ncbi:hypothetical protein DSAG12_00858 [Promethearchaeum syntrophicum]|uniref:Uncharacterized protein n=1 Tax=Promethearchaeum syntrophicum TaxID=2594042 RepID=A0A5B9D7Q6_9ARCH|nr:hypothetical protein [Candidatus Prometheoarchaeum syntrophicum]QEE15035.1 hypothetical protein DSAG12_00858 [Candidatus Prometheoarchaeum syntrophicum]
MNEKEPSKEKEIDFSISEMISDFKKEKKKIENLSTFVDYVVEETMPKVFGENIEKAYENSKKTADFIMRHII